MKRSEGFWRGLVVKTRRLFASSGGTVPTASTPLPGDGGGVTDLASELGIPHVHPAFSHPVRARHPSLPVQAAGCDVLSNTRLPAFTTQHSVLRKLQLLRDGQKNRAEHQ